MTDETPPCNLDRNRIYQEAGAMLRHYSITRTSILSVAFTLAFGIGAYSFNYTGNQSIVIFLVIIELLLMVIALAASTKLSSVIKLLQDRLRSFEGGTPLLLHRAVNEMWVSGEWNVDHLDRMCIGIVLLLNAGLILAHFYILK